jgi:hypothetical protein
MIVWTKPTFEKYDHPQWAKDRGYAEGDAKPTFEGRVVGSRIAQGVRIMSDVWANLTYAVVWCDKNDAPFEIQVRNSEFGGETSQWDVDGSGEVMVKYTAWRGDFLIAREKAAEIRKIADDKRSAEEAEANAKNRAHAVRKGGKVKVVKGRKVPKGTVGECFWEGGGQYGPRIGLKEADGTTHWTATSNCTAILDDVPEGTTPDGGWIGYMDGKYKAEEAAAALLPKKGEWVKVIRGDDDCKFGRIFWAKGTRIGIKMNPRDKTEDPVWTNAEDVVVLTGDPRKGGAVAVEGLPVPAPAPEVKPNPMAEMPYPYCAIKNLKIQEGMWKAFDAEGGFLMDLTADAAIKLMEKLSNPTVA